MSDPHAHHDAHHAPAAHAPKVLSAADKKKKEEEEKKKKAKGAAAHHPGHETAADKAKEDGHHGHN